MKSLTHPWLSIAAPLLIVLAILGISQRQGSDKIQSVPAFFVGAGLTASSLLGHRRNRKKLLVALRRRSSKET